MKFKLWILTSCLFLQSYHIQGMESGITFNRLMPETINLAEQSIKKELFWDKIYRASAFSAVGVGLSFALYKLLNASSAPQVIASTAPVLVPTSSFAQGEQLSLTPEAINKIQLLLEPGGLFDQQKFYFDKRNLEDQLKNNQTMFSWFYEWCQLSVKSTAQQLVIAMLLTGLNINSIFGPFAKYMHKIDQSLDRGLTYLFHSNTLSWFIGSHADLVFAFNKMEETCAALQGESITIAASPLVENVPTPVIASHSTTAELITFWNLYIQQMHMILGFMQFKVNQYTEESPLKTALGASGLKIMQLTNEFAGRLEEQMINNDPSKSDCFAPLKELRAQIGNELSNFSYMESFKRHDFLIEQK